MTSEAFSKDNLRRIALARRAALAPEARRLFSERLLAEGLTLARRAASRVAAAFHPVRDEPDTIALVAALAADGVKTALPVTVGRGEPLTFRLWRPGDPTVAGFMRIAEPTSAAAQVEPDLLFVPLSVFDRRGHRIGYGGGHYDRTLTRLRALKPIIAVGVAYGVSEVEAIPDQPHDQRLDFILTESELIRAEAA